MTMTSDLVFQVDDQPRLLSPFAVTPRKAMALIDRLRELPTIQQVEVFGSVLHPEEMTNESDLDLIICVDDELAARWQTDIDDARLLYAENGREEMNYHFTGSLFRRHAALQLLGIQREVWESAIDPARVDPFLFPSDWRDRLGALQRSGGYPDPTFMGTVADTAKLYVRGFVAHRA